MDLEDSGWARIGVAGALAKEYSQDAGLFIESLYRLLEASLPERTEPVYSGGIFHKKLAGLSVQLGEDRFRLEHKSGVVSATRTHIVRGIALKTEPIPIEEWIQIVGDRIQELAQTNERTRKALQGMLN